MQTTSESVTIKKPGKEFWLEHVNQWESGNLSQRAYCKQAGINYSTFVYWRGQFLPEIKAKPCHFLPVEIKQAPSDTSHSIKIKLVTGNIICIPTNIGIPEIAKLIRLLETPDA